MLFNPLQDHSKIIDLTVRDCPSIFLYVQKGLEMTTMISGFLIIDLHNNGEVIIFVN